MLQSLVDKGAASQTPSQISKYYYGSCEKTVKERYNIHTAIFTNKNKQKSRKLFKHIWKLKRSSTQYQINWDIAV